jgi:hypothetical protein
MLGKKILFNSKTKLESTFSALNGIQNNDIKIQGCTFVFLFYIIIKTGNNQFQEWA